MQHDNNTFPTPSPCWLYHSESHTQYTCFRYSSQLNRWRSQRNDTKRGSSCSSQPPPPRDCFVSSLFLVPKKGGQHPVINLKGLNQFLEHQHFKMEGIHMLQDLLKENNHLVKIDLKDPHFTIPIWKNHQKYLQFLWKDTLLEFTCLPFGLASAPLVLTNCYTNKVYNWLFL